MKIETIASLAASPRADEDYRLALASLGPYTAPFVGVHGGAR